MVPDQNSLMMLIGLWVVLYAIIFYRLNKKRVMGVGLITAYLVYFALIHWFGAFIYILPANASETYDIVYNGFVESTFGLVSIWLGSICLLPIFKKIILTFDRSRVSYALPYKKLPEIYVIVAYVTQIIFNPILRQFASFKALGQAWSYLLATGICIGIWKSWYEDRSKKKFMIWLMLAFVMPVTTLIGEGFMSYGVSFLTIVFAFISSFYRPRRHMVVGTIVTIFLGLSFYVNYMTHRGDLRAVVWSSQSKVAEKIDASLGIFKNFEWIDFNDEDHLAIINTRLNQNELVGKAMAYIEAGYIDFAKGETIQSAFLSMIPRLLWKDKPHETGSGDLVPRYTGTRHDDSTSIGVGQVLEFYINYGRSGILIGFFILGGVLALMDSLCAAALNKRDWNAFAFCFVPAIGIIQPQGSLIDIAQASASAVIFAFIINRIVLYRYQSKKVRVKNT